jgi:hypothetical protein
MIPSSLLILPLAVSLVPGALLGEDTTATYQVTFERTWSSASHPADVPLLALFSPVIGVTHGSGYELFAEGATPSPGIEKLCEDGKHQPLDSEIRNAVGSGTVGSMIATLEPIRDVPGRAEMQFEIDATHPMVSIAAMIAPSPDWCAVAVNVNLLDDGKFVSEKTVDLIAWDAGTDSATRYRALDSDTQPRGKEMHSSSPYFVRNDTPVPVGRVTFVRR